MKMTMNVRDLHNNEGRVAAYIVARNAMDVAEAERIRADLAADGITLEETADGTVWRED